MLTGLHADSDSDYLKTNYEYDAWGHLVKRQLTAQVMTLE